MHFGRLRPSTMNKVVRRFDPQPEKTLAISPTWQIPRWRRATIETWLVDPPSSSPQARTRAPLVRRVRGVPAAPHGAGQRRVAFRAGKSWPNRTCPLPNKNKEFAEDGKMVGGMVVGGSSSLSPRKKIGIGLADGKHDASVVCETFFPPPASGGLRGHSDRLGIRPDPNRGHRRTFQIGPPETSRPVLGPSASTVAPANSMFVDR